MQQESIIGQQKRTLRERGICVIVPTFNNGGTVADIVRRSMEQCDDVIVVCDGCTDSTVEILESMSEKADILVFEKNRGKGIALRDGFRHALERGFSYAITIDSDGQHFPEDIPALLQANIAHPGSIIVGERKDLDKVERSGASKFANKFSNFWFALQTGHHLADTQTGYRLYPLKKLCGLSLLTSRYEAELELMVFASWSGVPLVGTPVNVYYPPREERVSHFRPGKDFARITVLNTVLCFLAVVYGWPRSILRSLLMLLKTAYSLVFFFMNTLFIMTPLVHIYMSIGKDTEKKKDNLHKVLNFMARFLLYRHGIPGVKYTQDNTGGEDFSKPAIIICNHQSHLDLVPLLALTPKLVVVTAGYVWKNPAYRFTIRSADFLPVTAGMDVMLPKFRSLVEKGYSIAIYPEGTRSLDCSIGRFHQGAFLTASSLGADIVPLVLYGAGKALPKHGRVLRKWPMHMEIDTRITPQELCCMGSTTREQASAMRKYYIGRYTEIANRIEQDV